VSVQILSPEACGELLNVSRETLQRLLIYVDLLRNWTARINLVAPSSLEDIWRRHILDCGQLQKLVPPSTQTLVDIGSGAGLPGLVLAILGVKGVTLIESDQRKCAFLREAARRTETTVAIQARRVEEIPPFPADVITARAVASLPNLLDHASRFIADHSICLLLKGRTAGEELTEARKSWRMSITEHGSTSDPFGVILLVERLSRELHS
jgi:16S rRNA (guanine527-N7)-methyltransferase